MMTKQLRIKRGVWTKRGDWQPTYVYDQQHQTGRQYQHYMYAADGKPLCAGVTRHQRMNRAVAKQIVRVWERWRKEYVARNPGNYPTAQQIAIPVARIAVFPVNPTDYPASTVEWFQLP